MTKFGQALSLCVFGCLLLFSGMASSAPLCPDGRATLNQVAEAFARIETEGKQGRMWNRLFRTPGGAATFYVVLERAPLALVYVFHNDCLVIVSNALPVDGVLAEIGKTDRATVFGDKGI